MRYITSGGPALRLVSLAGLSLLSFLLASPGTCRGESNESAAAQAARIDRQWETRRQQVPSFRCRATGTVSVAKEAFAIEGITLPEDTTFAASLTCLFDPRGQRFRIERRGQTLNSTRQQFVPDDEIWVYTPNDLRMHYPAVAPNRGEYYSDRQADFAYLKGGEPVLMSTIVAPLLAHALIPASFFGEKGQAIVPLRAKNFTIQPRAMHEGRTVAVLSFRGKSSSARRELWVDSSSGLIRRAFLFYSDKLHSQLDLDYDAQNQLAGWTYVQFGVGVTPITDRIYTMVVEEFDGKPQFSPQDFVLEPTEGMVVNNRREKANFILGSDGRRIPLANSRSTNQGNYGWYFALAAGGILLVIGITIWMKRKWQPMQYG